MTLLSFILGTRNVFRVVDARLHWQKSGDRLAVEVTRYGKKKLDAKATETTQRKQYQYSQMSHQLEVYLCVLFSETFVLQLRRSFICAHVTFQSTRWNCRNQAYLMIWRSVSTASHLSPLHGSRLATSSACCWAQSAYRRQSSTSATQRRRQTKSLKSVSLCLL